MLTSLENRKVKHLSKLLLQRKHRDVSQEFLVEEIYLLDYLVNQNYLIKQVFYCLELLDYDDFNQLQGLSCELVEVSPAILQKITYRKNPQGFVCLVEQKSFQGTNLLKGFSNIFILDSVEKPGNIGAIIRSLLAFDIDALVLCGQTPDLFNSNLIRAARGANFILPTFHLEIEELVNKLEEYNFAIYTLDLKGKKDFFTEKFPLKTAIILGSEAKGISNEFLLKIVSSSTMLKIPMNSCINSLNVSITAAICASTICLQKKGR